MKKILILLNLGIIISMSGCSKDIENSIGGIAQVNVKSKIVEDSIRENDSEDVLGSDLFSKRFELEETIYSIPITIKELEDKGWSIQNDSLRVIKSGEKNLSIILENNSKTICVSIENNNLRDSYVENCIVNGVLIQKSEELQTKINLPGNITIGSTKKEVELAFEDIINYDEIRESDDVINYVLSKDGFSVSVMVDKSTDKVFCISLSEI